MVGCDVCEKEDKQLLHGQNKESGGADILLVDDPTPSYVTKKMVMEVMLRKNSKGVHQSAKSSTFPLIIYFPPPGM